MVVAYQSRSECPSRQGSDQRPRTGHKEQLVMPPLEPLDPPEGDIVPYPNEILILSGNRHLSMLGEVLTEDDPRWHLGSPVEVKDNTRRYWEGRAAVAGYTLAELLAEDNRDP